MTDLTQMKSTLIALEKAHELGMNKIVSKLIDAVEDDQEHFIERDKLITLIHSIQESSNTTVSDVISIFNEIY